MIPVKYCISETLMHRSCFKLSTIFQRSVNINNQIRCQKCLRNPTSNTLFQPVTLKTNSDDIEVGAELVGTLQKESLMKILNSFKQMKELSTLSTEYGLNDTLQKEALIHFQNYCIQTTKLPTELHIIFNDIHQNAGNVTDIFPYFIRHAKQIFPHINCIDDLKKISDLRNPASWYPIARKKRRKIIFHAGPTNSGKTYHALKRLMSAKSGVYCGPLKLLAVEVFNKCNKNGTPCDLITGEERKYAINENSPASHISSTVEMTNVNNNCEVAVIDEIQLIRDTGRGWAWTRALLGIPADEIHLCGETSAIDLVQSICLTMCEEIEVHQYKRLTQLKIEDNALQTLNHVMPGDCIVCFNKNDIYTISRELESKGKEVAVIYGSLPPTTKLAQCAKFNDKNSKCKILVATDAIGMGLNLHIQRIIFYSLTKPTINEKGEKEIDTISVSSALQIAGRAGRYGTQWEQGFVTTFKSEDLPILRNLLNKTPEVISKAGLHPTADQIELYAYYLPHSKLSNLMDIFISLSTVDNSLYFMCNVEDFKFLADLIQHVSLPLRTRYVFCCAPINRKLPFVCSMFLKFARQYSKNDAISFSWLKNQIGWPLSTPKTIVDLIHLESVFDVLDLYLWLSYRFVDLFPNVAEVKTAQSYLDSLIENGIIKITLLIRNSELGLQQSSLTINEQNVKNKFKSALSRNNRREKRGRLTETLLSEGILTPKMLETLQKEWTERFKNELKYRNK